jgi:hypothetical protein
MATPTSLPASFTAGQVLTAAEQNGIRGAFRVLQLFVQVLDTQQTSTTTTFADITGASVTITPQAASNKILIMSASALLSSGAAADTAIKFLRDATSIYSEVQAILASDTGGNYMSMHLDSPNTTSAITYKAQFNRNFGAGTIFSSIASTAGAFLVAEISA